MNQEPQFNTSSEIILNDADTVKTRLSAIEYPELGELTDKPIRDLLEPEIVELAEKEMDSIDLIFNLGQCVGRFIWKFDNSEEYSFDGQTRGKYSSLIDKKITHYISALVKDDDFENVKGVLNNLFESREQ